MTKFTSLLVGAHFRPPAKSLLTFLASGQILRLEPEPENPYDENAIKVILDTQDLDFTKLNYDSANEALASQGFTLDDILAEPSWHLGYVARDGNKDLVKVSAATGLTLVGNSAFSQVTEAKLTWGPSAEALIVATEGTSQNG